MVEYGTSRVFDFAFDAKRRSDVADFDIHLAFDRCDLRGDNDSLVSAEVYAGCRGATVCLFSSDMVIKRGTQDSTFDVTYTLNLEEETAIELNPTVKIEKAGASVEAGLITLKESGTESSQAEYKGTESDLTLVINPERTQACWSLYLPRGKKVVKDFYQGNRELEASAECKLARILVSVEGRPTGRIGGDSLC